MTKLNKNSLLLILLLFSAELDASFRTEVYSAYINNRMDIWRNVIEKMSSAERKNPDFMLELVNYQYGYIGYCVTFGMKEEARKYLDLAEENVGILEKQEFRLASVYAYKSAFYGMRMELNPLLVPFYGPKAIKYSRLALESDSTDYLALLQRGNVLFRSPSSAGGSRSEGIRFFIRALSALERDPAALKENWNYINLLTMIGQSYDAAGDLKAAAKVYRQILDLEPGFSYVKNDLYPSLLRKMKS